MSRKIFHRIDEIPRRVIKNNSKIGKKYLTNPVIWIFTECCVVPYFCSPFDYKDKIKEILQDSQAHDGLNGVLFWAYRCDLVPIDVRIKMSSEAFNRNRYIDILNK